MLTQGPVLDPKCKLDISSFLTLPHLLDYLICTRKSVSIILLLWMMGEWWGVVDSYQGVGDGKGAGDYLIVGFFTCAFFFRSLLSCLIF